MNDGIGHVRMEYIQVKYVRLGRIQHVELIMVRRCQVCQHEQRHVIHEIELDQLREVLNLHGSADWGQKQSTVVQTYEDDVEVRIELRLLISLLQVYVKER